MAMIRIQALEWTQGRIQDIILNHVTTDWPVYGDMNILKKEQFSFSSKSSMTATNEL